MLVLTSPAAVAAALNDPTLDPYLRTLIGRRAGQFYASQNPPWRDGIKVVVVEGGDTPEVINEALGFPITGKDAEEASFTWLEDHGRWFELAYPKLRTFIFVENGPGTELGLHYLCLCHVSTEGDEGGR